MTSLRDHALLASVEPATIAEIEEFGTPIALTSGAKLIAIGSSPRTLYFVLDGELAVHLHGLDKPPVAVLGAGQTVGEMSIILGGASTADVVAKTPARVFAIGEADFWRIVNLSHAFAIGMLNLLARRMSASNAHMRQAQEDKERAERDAMSDGLTGVSNRRWLDDRLPRIMMRHRRDHAPLTVMILDVDHFKKFNDTYGHAVGDHVLRTVATVLASALRPPDSVARYGGEEFVVILPATDLPGGVQAAERVRERVAATSLDQGDGVRLPPVHVSIGVANLTADDTAETLLARADACLYRAKQNGRNRVES
jgi:diguanylate cyclase (GGDEF)-like protein